MISEYQGFVNGEQVFCYIPWGKDEGDVDLFAECEGELKFVGTWSILMIKSQAETLMGMVWAERSEPANTEEKLAQSFNWTRVD